MASRSPISNCRFALGIGGRGVLDRFHQMYFTGKRKPINISILSILFSSGAITPLEPTSRFQTVCTDELHGVITETIFVDGTSGLVCKIYGIPTAAGTGALVRPHGMESCRLWAYDGDGHHIICVFRSASSTLVL